jgi:hypothetical protein
LAVNYFSEGSCIQGIMVLRYNLLLLLALIIASFPADASAAPTNDLFVNRTVINGVNVTVQGNNSGANSEPGEDTGSGNVYRYYSVWYSWTAPSNGVVYFYGNTSANNFIMSVRVYRGNAVNALTLAPTVADGGVPVTVGDTVAVQVASIYYPVWGGGGGTGPFSLTVSLEIPAPTSANDFYTNRFLISTPTYHFSGSIYQATNEPGEPLPDTNRNQTLWWKILPSEDGVMNLSPSTPQFSPTFVLYQGSQLQSLIPVAPLHDFFYRLQAGQEYALQMSSGSVPGGGFTLDTRFYSLRNDMFAGSEYIEGTNIVYYGNFSVATFEPNEPQPGGTNTVWVSWIAPLTGAVHYNVATSYQFQYCTAFTGTNLASLQTVPIVALGNRVYGFLAVEGRAYHFQFSGGADTFTFTLAAEPLGPVTNDNFADALLVRGGGIYYEPKSVMGATMELGEPQHMGPVPQKSLWWKWQAPLHGTYYVNAQASLVTNVVLAAYTGNAVATLTLVAKATNILSFPVTAGNTYYFAGAVPEEAIGNITLYSQYAPSSSASRPVPGNVLKEWSWEGTGLFGAQYWHWTNSLGGYVNEPGDCDGTTWPVLGGGTKLWQDFPTIAGHEYAIKFATFIGRNLSGCCGDAHLRVLWDTNALAVFDILEADAGFWHWTDYTMRASNSVSRLTFENLGRNLEMDAFSVVDLTAAPAIITQPASASSVAGGTVAFAVGASGSAPLGYQWFFEGSPLASGTNYLFVLENVSTNQIGGYWVTVSNALGVVTSAVASLSVDAPFYPTIVWQPFGDTVAAGAYYGFSVAAVGTMPLDYQWYFDGSLLSGATNRTLSLTNVAPADAGVYTVRIQNVAGTVWSLPATLVVTTNFQGGGTVYFLNRFYVETNVDAPVYDLDGITRLSGVNFQAQLYAGPTLEWLRRVGQPIPFRTNAAAGYVLPQLITLANVPPGGNAVAQVRAWDARKANSYEESRALGGRFGKSQILSITVGGGDALPPGFLVGLQSFNLQAGLPRFTAGSVQFVESLPDGTMLWSVSGEPGYHYLVEKALEDLVWRPFVVLTNVTGTVNFTDSPNGNAALVLYRSRILD